MTWISRGRGAAHSRSPSARVAVRHSRHRDGATIVYNRDPWATFTAGAKNGDFDL